MPGSIALAARLLLAAVFAVAGCAKLADRGGTRTAVVEFGGPEPLAAPLAVLIPLAELAVAVLLLPVSTAVAGAAGALALLGVFSAAIGINVARGRAPECHCFGQLHSAPAGWRTLVRNAALAAVAVVALIGDRQPSAVAWIGRLSSSGRVGLAAGAVAAILLAGGIFAFVSLLSAHGRVLVRLDRIEQMLADNGLALPDEDAEPELGLAPGSPAPVAPGLEELLAKGQRVLLLFTSPRCGPCRALLPRAASWQRIHADVLTVAFAIDAPPDDVQAEAKEFGLGHVLHDDELELYNGFHGAGTPGAVLIEPDGTVASWIATGTESIERLLTRALEPPPPELGLAPGTEVPDLELQALDGRRVALRDLEGRKTLVLFWNPGCGFCRSMHDDLLQLERAKNGDDPRLVIVSSGSEEATEAEGFDSLVLLDESFATGNAFAAGGTPTAVLLGADGRVASRVVVGADAVLTLARSG